MTSNTGDPVSYEHEVLREFLNLFEECIDDSGCAPVSLLVNHISSSVKGKCPNDVVEGLINSILGDLHGAQYVEKVSFMARIEDFLKLCTRQQENDIEEHTENDMPVSAISSIRKLNKHHPDETEMLKKVKRSEENCNNNNVFSMSIDELLEEKHHLERLCNQLQLQIQHLEENNVVIKLEKNQIFASLENARGQLKECESLNEDLQNELKKKEYQCVLLHKITKDKDEAEAKMNELCKKIADETEAFVNEQKKCEELQENLKRKRDELLRLKQKMTSVVNENETLKANIMELEQKLETQKKLLNDCRKALESSQQELLADQCRMERERQEMEVEHHSISNRFYEVSSAYQELKLENIMLKDSGKNYFEISCETSESGMVTEDAVKRFDKEIDNNIYSSTLMSSTLTGSNNNVQDSVVSLKDEMEAEGEFDYPFDGWHNISEICRLSPTKIEIVDKIEVQEEEEKTMEFSTETDDLLVVPDAAVNKPCALLSTSDSGLGERIEKQQTTIHNLIQKISNKFAKKSSSFSSLSTRHVTSEYDLCHLEDKNGNYDITSSSSKNSEVEKSFTENGQKTNNMSRPDSSEVMKALHTEQFLNTVNIITRSSDLDRNLNQSLITQPDKKSACFEPEDGILTNFSSFDKIVFKNKDLFRIQNNSYSKFSTRLCKTMLFLICTMILIMMWVRLTSETKGCRYRPLSYYSLEEIFQPYIVLKWDRPPPT